MKHDVPLSHLTSHLGYWLRYVSNHVSHAFARKLESCNVTVAEWVVLRELYGVPEAAPSLIAERLTLSRGAITKLADRLIVKELAIRKANPGDARGQALSLTNAGRKLVPKLSALADQNDKEFFGHLSPKDRDYAETFLKKLIEKHDLRNIPLK